MTLEIEGVPGVSARLGVEEARQLLLDRSVRTEDGCLVFRGYGSQRGVHQKTAGRAWAHLLAYVVWVGPRNPALVVAHLCRRKDCVEPTHLVQLPHAENMAMVAIARRPRCRAGHQRELNPATGRLRKTCPQCNAEAQRRWRQRQAEARARSLTPASQAAAAWAFGERWGSRDRS